MAEVSRKEVKSAEWTVARSGKVDEVHTADGSIRYNVLVRDGYRKPFINQWFSTEEAAWEFLKSIWAQSVIP